MKGGESDFVGCVHIARTDDNRLDGVNTPYTGVNGQTREECSTCKAEQEAKSREEDEEVETLTDEDLLSHDGVKDLLRMEGEIRQKNGYVR